MRDSSCTAASITIEQDTFGASLSHDHAATVAMTIAVRISADVDPAVREREGERDANYSTHPLYFSLLASNVHLLIVSHIPSHLMPHVSPPPPLSSPLRCNNPGWWLGEREGGERERDSGQNKTAIPCTHADDIGIQKSTERKKIKSLSLPLPPPSVWCG